MADELGRRTRQRRALVTMALAAAVGMTACTGPGHPAPPSPSASAVAAAVRCPVSRSSGSQPPRVARLNFGTVLTSSKVGWVGSGGLWAQLPSHGRLLTVLDRATGLFHTKFGWFRSIPGDVSVTGKLLEGANATFHADVGTVAEYGPTGFTPSVLQFARPGCWRLTGTLGRDRLAFVILVEATTQPP